MRKLVAAKLKMFAHGAARSLSLACGKRNSRDVVDAADDYYDSRVKLDYIVLESGKHVSGGVAGNSPIDDLQSG